MTYAPPRFVTDKTEPRTGAEYTASFEVSTSARSGKLRVIVDESRR